jgi:hypothetical protein
MRDPAYGLRRIALPRTSVISGTGYAPPHDRPFVVQGYNPALLGGPWLHLSGHPLGKGRGGAHVRASGAVRLTSPPGGRGRQEPARPGPGAPGGGARNGTADDRRAGRGDRPRPRLRPRARGIVRGPRRRRGGLRPGTLLSPGRAFRESPARSPTVSPSRGRGGRGARRKRGSDAPRATAR